MSSIPQDGDPGFLVCRCASEIEMKSVEWIWPGRIAVGAHTCIAGEPGTGKSQLSTYVAAQISMGREWPCGEGRAPQGSVLILSAEDSEASTIVPRLHAAEADLGRVYTISAVKADFESSRSFNLERDLRLLEQKINELGDVALVVIDPISSYLGKTNSHNNSEIRGVLEPLSAMADRTGVAILSVTHFSKSGAANGSKPIHRFIGSIAFVGAPRMAFALIEDADDKERRLLLGIKNNLAPEPQGLACKVRQVIVGDGIVSSRVDWEPDPVAITARDALAAEAESGGSRCQEAETFLRELLSDGAVPSKQVEKEADEAGISWRTVLRAKARLGVQSKREQGQDGQWQWVWYLPPTEASKIATSKSGNLGNLAEKTRENGQHCQDGQDCQPLRMATLPEPSGEIDLTLPECLRVENRSTAGQAA